MDFTVLVKRVNVRIALKIQGKTKKRGNGDDEERFKTR